MQQDRALSIALLNVGLAFQATFGAMASAQEADVLDTAVVTGRAGVEAAQKADLSYAVTSIDSNSLRREAPIGVADALKSVPGFWVESSGGEASANIRARTRNMLAHGLNRAREALPAK